LRRDHSFWLSLLSCLAARSQLLAVTALVPCGAITASVSHCSRALRRDHSFSQPLLSCLAARSQLQSATALVPCGAITASVSHCSRASRRDHSFSQPLLSCLAARSQLQSATALVPCGIRADQASYRTSRQPSPALHSADIPRSGVPRGNTTATPDERLRARRHTDISAVSVAGHIATTSAAFPCGSAASCSLCRFGQHDASSACPAFQQNRPLEVESLLHHRRA